MLVEYSDGVFTSMHICKEFEESEWHETLEERNFTFLGQNKLVDGTAIVAWVYKDLCIQTSIIKILTHYMVSFC